MGKIKKFLLYVILPLCVLILALIGAGTLYLHSSQSAAVEAARKAGFPTTVEELNALYPPLAGENAADLYRQAFNAFVTTPAMEEIINGRVQFDLTEQLPPEWREKLAGISEANKEAFDILKKAAAIKECQFVGGVSELLSGTPPKHYTDLRNAMRFLSVFTLYFADTGDVDAVMDSMLAQFAAVDSIRDEPTLLALLIRRALQAFSFEEIENVMKKDFFSDHQLALIGEKLGEWETSIGCKKCIPCEFFFAYQVSQYHLQTYVDLYTLASSPFPERFKKMQELSEQRLVDYLTPLRKLVRDNLLRTMDGEVRDLATIRVIRTALAVERYRKVKEKLPEKLEDLVPYFCPDVPQDPYDGKPIRISVQDDKVIVYSVGVNSESSHRSPRAISFTLIRH